MANKQADRHSKSSKSTKSLTQAQKASQVAKQSLAIGKAIKKLPVSGIIVAEFIGTFAITTSLLVGQTLPLFFMFMVVGAVLLSGYTIVHFNPAMTIAALLRNKTNVAYAAAHIAAQLVGAATALFVMNQFLNGSGLMELNPDATLLHAGAIAEGKEWYIFASELIGSFIAAIGFAAAFNQMRKNRLVAAFTYGAGIYAAMIFANSATAFLLPDNYTSLTFLNPAIAMASDAFSTILVDGKWDLVPVAVYVIAPMLGAIVGVFAYEMFDQEKQA